MKKFKQYAIILSLLCVLALTLSMTVACGKNGETPDSTTAATDDPSTVTDPIEECSHETTEWVVDVNATCTEEGSKHKECASCKESLETAAIPTTAHTEEIIPGKPATCSEKGITDGKKCSVCETVILEQEEIPTKNHTEEVVAGTSPTCTQKGITEGKICSVCKIVLVAQTEIPVINHTEEIIDGKPATCTATGLTSGKKCSVCQTVLVKQEEIALKNHTEETIVGKKATCTETGLTDGKKCSECNTVLLAQQEIAKLGHSESDWIIDKNAEIGVEGSKHTECTRCKEVLKTEKIPAMVETHVHEGKEWVIVIPSTCTKTGTKNLICDCGQIMETGNVDIIAHTEETVPGKAATCTATGLTDGKKCSECGTTLLEQTSTPLAPHTEEKVLGKAPTCVAIGTTDGIRCSVCGIVLQEPITLPTVAHTEETILGTSATCMSTGLTDGKKCSVCGKILVSQIVTAKTGHNETTVLGTAPTCTVAGLTDGKKCSVCTTVTVSQIAIPPTGHSFSSGTCKSCGIGEPYGLWIVDGQGNPMTDIVVKIMKDGQQVKMYPYKGEFLSIDVEVGTYQIVLDLSMLSETYSYDESLCVLTPETRTTTIRLLKSSIAETTLFVGYPISADYPAYYISEGATTVTLTPNDYTFFIFAPSTSAVYTITYECDSTLAISYHGGMFFVQGTDLTDSSSDLSRYGNGIALNVYPSNIGGEYVIGVSSTSATSCIISIKNVGDPGTRLEDEPWTPYLEDSAKVNEQLNMTVSGTYTTIDLTDLSVKAVYNEADGYYHLGSATGPIIFIDLTTDSAYVSSIQTICGYQRMGTYIYDPSGNVVEKRSYNELFIQYGMPDNADTTVDQPIRVALTEKLAEAIQMFGDDNGWWEPSSDANIFNAVLLGAPYNQEYAWLLFCGYYA